MSTGPGPWSCGSRSPLLKRPMGASMPGRNESCPCGSGKKYKKCCAFRTIAAPPRLDLTHLFALNNSGRFPELETEAWSLIETHRDVGILWKLLSAALWRQGKDALPTLEMAAKMLPNDAEAHVNLGIVQRARGRLEDAEASHRRAIGISSDYAEAHNNLGGVLRDLGRLDEALQSYRRALASKPDFALAHNNLGNVLLELARPEQAAESYRRAIAIKPDDVDAHNNLGNALRDLGRVEDAAASYRQAMARNPGSAEVHNNLGNALFDLGQPEDAVRSYLRALEIKPQFAKAHSNLASAYRELARLDEAEASYRRALALEPSHAEIRTNLGIVQRLSGRPADAEESVGLALASNPHSPVAIAFRAELHADRGQFADAESQYRRVISIEPDSPHAWAGLAAIRKMTGADRGWITEAVRIVGQRLRPREEVHLRYAIGKYFDDVQDYDAAFTHYRRANELTKTYRPPHDRRHLAQSFEFFAQVYGSDCIRQAAAHANVSSRPVFIVGTPRSGTSLAEQILASHPAVFGAGELSFWKTTSPKVAAAIIEGRAVGDVLPAVTEEYLRLQAGLSTEALRVIDKMPANFAYLGLIHAAFPRARIIHMQRNPIDACLSIYFQNFHLAHSYANDLGDLAHFYGDYLRVMDHWRSILPAGTILDVPYEQLVQDQEAWSRKMVAFAGLPWDARCLEFHRTDRSVSTFSKWQVRQKITKTSVERWRNYEKFVGPLLDLAESNRRAVPAG
jgi:tetratricopeptide (TPR) repeat protein